MTEPVQTKGDVLLEILNDFKNYLRGNEELKDLYEKFDYDLEDIITLLPFILPSCDIEYDEFKEKIIEWGLKISKKNQAKLYPVFKSFLKKFSSV
jgi:hypothetical protein